MTKIQEDYIATLEGKLKESRADAEEWQTSVLEQGEVIDQLKAQRDELLAALEKAIEFGDIYPPHVEDELLAVIASVKGTLTTSSAPSQKP